MNAPRLPLLLGINLLLAPLLAWPQAIPNHSPLGSPFRNIEKQTWHVFGRVTSLDGEPVNEATVRVDIGSGLNDAKTLQTTLRGEFRTEYSLDAQSYQRLSVTVMASKAGLRDARETVDFGAAGRTWEIDLTMLPLKDEPGRASLSELVSTLGAELRKSAARSSMSTSTRKGFSRAAAAFLDRHDPATAAPLLGKVAKAEPAYTECQTLYALALLASGGETSASRQLAEAAGLTAAKTGAALKPEPLVVLGVLESWKHEDKKAAGFFTQALEAAPDNPLALQELGRLLILQQEFEGAEKNLTKAIKSGAPKEAHLLRAQALVEIDAPAEAEADIKAYLGRKKVKDLPESTRATVEGLQSRLQLASAGKVKSIVGQPLPELIAALPELKTCQAAESQEELPLILGKAGDAVAKFFRNFPDTASAERIRQERIGRDGKVHDSLDQDFRYLLLARPEKWGLGLEEYRTDSLGTRTAPHGLEGGFMLTAGFASASVPFHPAYQPEATFRLVGRQTLEGRPAFVVGFAQLPDKAKAVERFNVEDKAVTLLLQGLAWIDARNYSILRMRTDLLDAPPEIRLARQTTEIHFREVQFKGGTAALWLPREVAVTVEWKGKTFRNLHRYSNFKLFNVETEEKPKAAELAPIGSPGLN